MWAPCHSRPLGTRLGWRLKYKIIYWRKWRKGGGRKGPGWASMKAEDIWAWAGRGLCLPCSYELVWIGSPSRKWQCGHCPRGSLWWSDSWNLYYGSQPTDYTAYRVSTFRKLKGRKILSTPEAGAFQPAAVLLYDFGERHLSTPQWLQMAYSVLVWLDLNSASKCDC